MANRPLSLPVELLDAVFSNLESAADALQACTLVCRSWLALCRPYLFRTVVCRPTQPSLSITELIQFLIVTPEIVRHVRILKV
ncbi:hypothetical protein C8Q76DRAFT_631368, partial [Earliella scabrosa]